MSVKKSPCTVYDIHSNGEHASVVLRSWRRTDTGRPAWGGELVVHSSFGMFGHIWSNIARPFNEHLVNLTADTFLLKTLGAQARVYCEETTRLKFNAHIGKLYAQGTLRNEQAELILATFEEELADVDARLHSGFVAAVSRTEEDSDVVESIPQDVRERVFAEAVLLQGFKPNPAGMSFWNELWPELRAVLEQEVAELEVAHAG